MWVFRPGRRHFQKFCLSGSGGRCPPPTRLGDSPCPRSPWASSGEDAASSACAAVLRLLSPCALHPRSLYLEPWVGVAAAEASLWGRKEGILKTLSPTLSTQYFSTHNPSTWVLLPTPTPSRGPQHCRRLLFEASPSGMTPHLCAEPPDLQPPRHSVEKNGSVERGASSVLESY